MDKEQKTVVGSSSLEFARKLVREIENGNEAGVEAMIDELANLRESSLFIEVGKLTRQLHDAMNSFQLDARLANIADKEFPDARERLNYVIAMTDKAANTTLNAIEDSIPLCEELEKSAESMASDWQRFTSRQMSADEFRKLSPRIGSFFARNREQVGRIKNNLTEVLMAQDFQDLTGQVIKKVITLVEDVESNLVSLIKLAGAPGLERRGEEKEAQGGKSIKAEGPVVPGVDDVVSDVVSGQDEVDDLLSSLGF
ncbi:MAG TPA: protein phosphatase CheZ [Gammaproteobacteria bacterium]|nr:protein phosphatase CheZ [Gammaproteobacteria bacterium]